jgi:alkanesulfonate monooxygenase SsuD/methylene tetrahydromethanopterin reductase-like flavin-dependent oxidoreductase (luciferase family)
MKFGLFGSAQARRGGPDLDSGQGFRDFIEYNIEAEALGYASTFLVEHHFTGLGQVSATLNLLTWVAAKTKTLRLGTAVMVLPWHNPVLLAEQAATIDLLSGGRLEFGVGKGYRHNEFAGFCIPMAEADERFEEGLALILKSWTSEQRFSHRGKYWRFDNIIVEPPTAQKPHPPIWIAAGSPDSIRKVARRGAKLLLDQLASPAIAIERFNVYKSEVEACGRRFDPMDVGLARAFLVARSPEEKAKAVQNRLEHQRRLAVLSSAADSSTQSSLSFADTLEASEESAMFGTPDEIAEKLDLLRKGGIEYVLLNGPAGSRENLRSFARQIMPAFAK